MYYCYRSLCSLTLIGSCVEFIYPEYKMLESTGTVEVTLKLLGQSIAKSFDIIIIAAACASLLSPATG